MTQTANLLLNMLSQDALRLVSPHLLQVRLEISQKLEIPGEPTPFVHFCESGIISRVVQYRDERIETGITGREGAVGISLVHDWPLASLDSFVQVPGDALRMSAADFRKLIQQNEEFRSLTLRFSLVQSAQVAHTLLAGGRFPIRQRAARWILMYDDRLPDDQFPLTHEFMALMLGVRRAGVTTEMHVLEGEGAIKNVRATVIIRDRRRLEDIAGAAYGAAEKQYAEIMGRDFRQLASR